MAVARAVTVIQPIVNRFSPVATQVAIKRVAAYARVSTDNDEQLSSFDAQMDYYTRHIKSNPAWTFVEVYTDEGISATSTKKRDGFNRMISDGLDGKIDLIITKSVSRFARNTVDSLTTVRKLKEKGVEIYFEKENIYTMDSKGELLITIMSSLAQEESRSISENVTWGQRKRFADGKVSLPYGQFLGYEKGEDGLPKIVEKEALVVRLIYKLFLEGKTPAGIAKYLTTNKILTPAGKDIWQPSTVLSILKNEKYKGAAMLQKCVEENAHSALDQAKYEKRYKALAERYESIKKGLEGINEKRFERSTKQENIMAFIKELEQRDGLITEFDEELWNGTIEKVMVNTEDKITFIFKDGMELEWNI